jgi:hypothetical protein
MLTRREWLRVSGAALAAGLPLQAVFALGPGDTDMTVYKTPTCGCCKNWVEHMRTAGFTVKSVDLDDVSPYKKKYGVTPDLASCHTALVGGYVVEGHVPADVVKQLLKSKPKLVGIAVPGMPAGSPGMEGGRKDKYDVIAFDKAGKHTVYASR